MSIMVILMLIAGFLMDDYIEPPLKWQIFGLHEATGVLILTLVILRLLWKFYNTTVLLPADLPNWQKKAAAINKYLISFNDIDANKRLSYDYFVKSSYRFLRLIYYTIFCPRFTIRQNMQKNPPKSSFIIYCSDYSSYTSCVLSSFY